MQIAPAHAYKSEPHTTPRPILSRKGWEMDLSADRRPIRVPGQSDPPSPSSMGPSCIHDDHILILHRLCETKQPDLAGREICELSNNMVQHQADAKAAEFQRSKGDA